MRTERRILLPLVVAALLAGLWSAPVAAQSGGPLQPLVHVVQRGDTLFSIARRYGTTVDAIAHANGLADPRHIYVGQRLVIPGGVLPIDSWSAHVVRPGETLPALAARYGLPWETLALANRLVNPHLLYAGQVIRIPASTEQVGALHAVQPGESLIGIALRYGVGVWNLIEANRLDHPNRLLPGQWLFIPGAQPSWLPYPFRAVDLSPLPVPQGKALLVAVRTAEPVSLTGALFDRPVAFAEEAGVYYAVVGVHAFTEPGLYELTLVATLADGRQVATSAGVVVEEGGYSYERIDVPPGRSSLLDPAVIAAERERLEAVRGVFTPARRWHGPFLSPVEAAVSSYFGTRRSYNGGPYNSYHGGVDFDAGRGTPVRAPAAGTVVLAEPLTIRGNAVVIDHGWGVLTGYWHLSSIEVTVGQEVQAGDVIGRVGNTGLSTGAHLHWEVWVGGISVDGLQWLDPQAPWFNLDGASTSS
ncbi:MAG TPA: LysM peptidoglycan-binding domain-containing protein [Thermoflexia bacterium]|nr:LysM peptidoglycan-binding domain-containing protein [Thermoflexia bacterium]